MTLSLPDSKKARVSEYDIVPHVFFISEGLTTILLSESLSKHSACRTIVSLLVRTNQGSMQFHEIHFGKYSHFHCFLPLISLTVTM